MNISSIVVQTKPQNLNQVLEALKKCKECEYHLHDEKGRIIVTIEGENVKEELEKLRVVENIPHVISADMQMAYSEDELEQHIQHLENQDLVPKILHDDKVDVEDIFYRGNLKHKNLEKFTEEFDKVN